MLPVARSDASLMEDSRDEGAPGTTASTATSAPAVAAWELLDARRTLKECVPRVMDIAALLRVLTQAPYSLRFCRWTLTRFLAARPASAPVVFHSDTTIGSALKARHRVYVQKRGFVRAVCLASSPQRAATQPRRDGPRIAQQVALR